jgi:hypothetical protein
MDNASKTQRDKRGRHAKYASRQPSQQKHPILVKSRYTLRSLTSSVFF